MRAVGYPRVSGSAQRERHTIESQLRVIPAYIERQGWALAKPLSTYVDDGRTAKAGSSKRTSDSRAWSRTSRRASSTSWSSSISIT
jgi:DNA invertase Pin-like site-specific DNA recombinase